MQPKTVFQRLSSLRWSDVFRTYGNAHASYIGLFSSWWLSLADEHMVMDPGTINIRKKKGQLQGDQPNPEGRGQCDAIFCVGNFADGILEVEGLQHTRKNIKKGKSHTFATSREQFGYVLMKVREHFRGHQDEFAGLSFAVICVHSTVPKKQGIALPDEFLQDALKLSQDFPDCGLILINVDKKFTPIKSGIRALSQDGQAWFEIVRIRGMLLLDGAVDAEAEFFRSGSQDQGIKGTA